MFNNLIKYPAFLLSDSFRLQRYEQKPSRATILCLFKIIKLKNLKCVELCMKKTIYLRWKSLKTELQ